MRPFEWLFRNRRTGEITLGQPPNAEITTVVVSGVVAWLFPDDRFGRFARVVSIGSLLIWALEELFSGVTPARRLTGLGTLALQAALAVRR